MTAGLKALTAVLALVLAGAAPTSAPTSRPTTNPGTRPSLIAFKDGGDAAYVLYLPGISAYRSIDRAMIRGLVDGSETARAGKVRIYNWSAYDAGMGALLGYKRNRAEADVVEKVIEKAWREKPERPIYVVAHSGGCGVTAWAMETLPAEVKVEQVVLLAPAVSPGFDLRGMMRHVRGKVWAFTSENDPVLGSMTKVLGTIDRVNSESAGLRGFVVPAGAEEVYGEKLRAMPYREEWWKLQNTGDHIGWLEHDFSKEVLAPLLVPGEKEKKDQTADKRR